LEINVNGTIAGVQSHLCFAASGTALVLDACSRAAAQQWTFHAATY
jgi:hypothetical protein